MPWVVELSPEFQHDYRKLCGKNSAFRLAVRKKVDQIRLHPMHFKPLRGAMHGSRRAHVYGSFVLVFEAQIRTQTILLLRLAHHDDAYQP